MKKNLRITVKGQTYDVVAEILDDDQPAAPITASSASVADIKAPAPVAAKPKPKVVVSGDEAGDVPSPIAGTVISIAKPVGTSVEAGEVLVVLEAMKMNTEVTSPASGKVTAVNVNPGDTVDEGQVLVTLA